MEKEAFGLTNDQPGSDNMKKTSRLNEQNNSIQ